MRQLDFSANFRERCQMSQSSGLAAPGRTSTGAEALRSRTGALARLRPALVIAGTAFAGLVAGRLARRLPATAGRRQARERGQS